MRQQKIVYALAQQLSKEQNISDTLYAIIIQYLEYAYAAGMDDPQGKRLRNIYFLNKRKRKPVEMVNSVGKVVQTFPSLTAAAEAIGVDKSAIGKVISGTNKSCKGFQWRYV